MKPDVLLSIRNLSAHYGSHRVWGPLSFSLAAGERVGLAGASGSGKSTLLEAVAGWRAANLTLAGELEVDGRVALLPQGSLESLSPFLRVQTQVPAGGKALPRPAAWPHELSGGERQRVLLEQALAQRAALLVADEPFAHLDASWQAALVERLRAADSALLIAAHDECVFTALGCTRVIRLSPEPEPMPLSPAPTVREGEALRATGLAKSYAQRTLLLRRVNLQAALVDASLVLARGETVALRGASGSGKSTLARCLAGRETPDAGTVVRTGPVQLAPQDPTRSLDPRRSVADALAEAGAVEEHLELVALDRQFAHRRPREMSEGQRARVALVRTMIAARGGVLILDESLAPLDAETRGAVLRALRQRQAETGLACLLITHDGTLARAVAHRECRMVEGRLT